MFNLIENFKLEFNIEIDGNLTIWTQAVIYAAGFNCSSSVNLFFIDSIHIFVYNQDNFVR